MIRRAAVAGHFYKGSPESLQKQVQTFLHTDSHKIAALGAMVPHAGFIYSGAVAGAVYSRLALPDTIVLIGPNHTGLGAPVSLMRTGTWQTPLGTVDIDEQLASAILDRSRHIHDDVMAHLQEHSLEVQLPFIQALREGTRIVPLQMMDTRLETCREVGQAIAGAITDRLLQTTRREEIDSEKRGAGRSTPGVLVIASSDMSHYERAERARIQDQKAIDALIQRDPEALYGTVRDNGITMCGYGPAVSMLFACNTLGATNAELIAYANSGDVSGDYEQVVGYAGVIIM